MRSPRPLTGTPVDSGGVLPSASFGHLVAEERRRARHDERDLALCVFECRDGGALEQLATLGRAYSTAFAPGRVGWLGEGRLCILVQGPRRSGERVVRWISRKNEELAGLALEARVWVYSNALQEEDTAKIDAASSIDEKDRSRGWTLPLCW